MQSKNTYLSFIILILIVFSCGSASNDSVMQKEAKSTSQKILPGAYQLSEYLPLLEGKSVAVVANQTSMINETSLIDTLLSLKVNLVKVFAPEHGFRGQASAGEHVKNAIDTQTGLPIISLYGKHRKPTPKDLADVDVVVFDIQDVGARFYTYLSTLHYVMEAAAEQKLPVIVLDRPNPNSDYIDGPVMQKENESFVGMHPVPIVYAMTIGEYAQMINGEHWLKNNVQADLKVIKIKNYHRGDVYKLPVKPSPNLPNYQAVRLYPSLCLFEGTPVSCGRGTDMQFQVYGAPFLPPTGFSFTPQVNAGSKWPKFKGKVCQAVDLRHNTPPTEIHLEWLIDAYQKAPDKAHFFNKFFDRLSGDAQLKSQIIAGKNIQEIKKSWQPGLEKFKKIRKKYLYYPAIKMVF